MNQSRIYEFDSYKKANDTIITDKSVEDGKIRITLEASIFFPEGGGQYADPGTITWVNENGTTITAKVLDGQTIDGMPWYTIDADLPVGAEVSCELDWKTRYSRMQQHSGEHILMGVIHNRFGYANTGFHISDTAPTTLVLSGMLTREEIDAVEAEANRMIYQNMDIIDSYPTDEELQNIAYRSKIEIEGQVRLITIKDADMQLDCCACCAPHVKKTGEVGLIKVVSIGRHKGGTSLEILAGERAFAYVKQQMDYMTAIANSLSTSSEKVAGVVENYRNEITRLKNKVGELTENALLAEVEAAKNQKNLCIFTEENLSTVSMKNVYNYMTEICKGYSAIFMGNDDEGYRYSAGSRQLDARDLAKLMREGLNARGGGKSDMIQGKVMATKAEIETFFQEV